MGKRMAKIKRLLNYSKDKASENFGRQASFKESKEVDKRNSEYMAFRNYIADLFEKELSTSLEIVIEIDEMYSNLFRELMTDFWFTSRYTIVKLPNDRYKVKKSVLEGV